MYRPTTPAATPNNSAVGDAQRLYRDALDVQREQRQQIEEDERFSDPSNPQQWDDAVRIQRESDPGGKRPCLVVDQLGQYVANVAGQIEKQPPGLHAIPVAGGADKLAAEQLDGRFRHIEYASRAAQHYQRAQTSAARLGVGYLIARPEYTNRALNWQEMRISSEPDALKVVFDPWSTELDGSDATFGYHLAAFSETEFKRRWPRRDACSFGDTEQSTTRDTRSSIIVADEWSIDEKKRNVIIAMAEDGERSMGEDEFHAARQAGEVLVYVRNYVDKARTVKWRRMSGVDVLEESEYPADSIGIVPVYGYVGFIDGRMRYCGIPRRARVPQQAYNYHASEALAYIGTAPKAPWIVAMESLSGAGVKEIWDQANTQQRAYLPYSHMDGAGNPLPPPQRTPTGTNVVNHESGMRLAREDIQAAIGMYQASLGAPSNESSGVAIESRKQQGEASTAHFPSHLAASLTQLGKIIMQGEAKLADTRRKVALIGVDGSAGSVTIDPEQQVASKRDEGGVTINPRIGDYGVRVVIGASYSTQRSQTNAQFSDIMRGNPDMVPIVAPFWAQTLDFPGSEKMAQAFAAMAPPPVKAILQPEGEQQGPQPSELVAEIEKLRAALQEATGIAQEAEQAESEALDNARKLELQLADKTASIEIDEYKAETDRLKVTGANVEQIEAIVSELVNQMLSSPRPLPGDAPQPLAPQIGGPEPQPLAPAGEAAPEPAAAPEAAMEPQA